jgi:hypothetical protein
VSLNEGRRWVSLNERKGRGRGYEGKKTSGEGDFWILGRGEFFILETVLGIFTLRDIGRLYLVLGWRSLVVGLLQGGTCCWEFWARGPGILTESWS